MKPQKKPPPDTVGNLRGRIGALKSSARRFAKHAAREGADYNKALARELRAVSESLTKYQERLDRAKKGLPPVEAPVVVPERPKRVSRGKVPADYDDLLATLAGL